MHLTLRTLLKRMYCVPLMFFVIIDRKFSGSIKNIWISSKNIIFHGNMKLHSFRCSKYVFRFVTFVQNCIKSPHILNVDKKSAFFTDFTLWAILKRQYCVPLMFWVTIGQEFSVPTKNSRIFFKIARISYKITYFSKKCVTESGIWCFTCFAIQNLHFDSLALYRI